MIDTMEQQPTVEYQLAAAAQPSAAMSAPSIEQLEQLAEQVQQTSTSGRDCHTDDTCAQRNVLADVGEWSCPVCLDTLYKPCVNVCGHVYCFWYAIACQLRTVGHLYPELLLRGLHQCRCINNAMSPFNPSKCPLCRHPYGYFPAVCPKLSLLLQLFSFTLCEDSPQASLPSQAVVLQACRSLHLFLSKAFPAEYAARRAEVEGESRS